MQEALVHRSGQQALMGVAEALTGSSVWHRQKALVGVAYS
jgi:hypothetical protein